MNTQLTKIDQLFIKLYQKKKIINLNKQQAKLKNIKYYKNLNLYYGLNNKIIRPKN
jgi:hypothetical protein